MLIHIHIFTEGHCDTITFDNQRAMQELFDYITATYQTELAAAMIHSIKDRVDFEVYEITTLESARIDRDMYLPLLSNKPSKNNSESDDDEFSTSTSIPGLSKFDLHGSEKYWESKFGELKAPQVSQLLAFLAQPIPDLVNARKLLTNIKTITLNSAEITPRILHNFWLALCGNTSLQKINSDLNDEGLYAVIKAMLQYNETASLHGIAAQLLETTTNNSAIYEENGFENYDFQPILYAMSLSFKLRINLAAESYEALHEPVAAIITALNRKYAFDLYTPPLQSFKSTLLDKDLPVRIEIYQTLLSDVPDKEKICDNLIEKIQDEKQCRWLRYCISCASAGEEIFDGDGIVNLSEHLEHEKTCLVSHLRFSQQAQFTLYPSSDHNPRDIRLLFLIRDLEIALTLHGIQPNTKLATTDAPVGQYVSFRQQLLNGTYVAGDADADLLQELNMARLASPNYLFLKDRTPNEIYQKMLHSKTPEGVVALLDHCCKQHQDDFIKQLIQNLIREITTKKLTIPDILQAFDVMLLKLHDSFYLIDDKLLGISYCFDAAFAPERAALVAAGISPVAATQTATQVAQFEEVKVHLPTGENKEKAHEARLKLFPPMQNSTSTPSVSSVSTMYSPESTRSRTPAPATGQYSESDERQYIDSPQKKPVKKPGPHFRRPGT
ncbi:MAG TPA: hypothetical protein VLI69_07560 [Gammaproteobacteria bacterium]|nr:hypothetical protein [Gammaproteobacteria bacterium]